MLYFTCVSVGANDGREVIPYRGPVSSKRLFYGFWGCVMICDHYINRIISLDESPPSSSILLFIYYFYSSFIILYYLVLLFLSSI